MSLDGKTYLRLRREIVPVVNKLTLQVTVSAVRAVRIHVFIWYDLLIASIL